MPSSKTDREFLRELKKKDKKRRKVKEKKKRKHSDSESESDSDGSDMDLSKEIFPISHYANDKEEMINQVEIGITFLFYHDFSVQVFSVIKGKKLKSMLPPFLVDMDVDDVKALCLEKVIRLLLK